MLWCTTGMAAGAADPGWFVPGSAFADGPDDVLFVRLDAQYEF